MKPFLGSPRQWQNNGGDRMVEDTKKERVIAITSYCNTEEKLNVLIVNISLIRSYFPDYKIALHANYPLSTSVQKLVDIYLSEDLNHIDEDKWIYYWDIISENDKILFNKKFYYSIQDSGFSVFKQIRALTNYLIDYEWVILINYDTSVEEIRIQDYTKDYSFTGHFFPDHKAYSLIMMYFKPSEFVKVTKNFTYENWAQEKRKDQLNEERFMDMIHESRISVHGLDYKVSDKVSGEPDYLKPNAPANPYFTNYLLYYHEDILEVYLWGEYRFIESIDVIFSISTISPTKVPSPF